LEVFFADQVSSVQQIIVEKHFGNDYPQLNDIRKKCQLVIYKF